jgi:rhodanese-related sulfurtransferase
MTDQRNDPVMPDAVETIPPKDLWRLIESGPVRLIDVRTAAEFARVHAREATNVPLDELDPVKFLAGPETGPIYFICRAGVRGRLAGERILAAEPTARVVVVEGGTLAWQDAGLPVVRGPDPRRWIKRAGWAGLILSAVSVFLAIFVHRGLLGIGAIVAAVAVGVMTWDLLRWRAVRDL